MRRHSFQQGIGYVWAICFLALMTIGLGKALELHHQSSLRLKEAELLYIGNQYRQAIRDYYHASPGMVKRYPSSLEDLLLDKRLLTTRRYIRKLYEDPITRTEWGLVREREGGIIGIHSLSDSIPIKQANFSNADTDFSRAARYSDWRFIYTP